MAVNLLINTYLSASLQQLWAFIESTQVLVLVAMFKLSLPATAGIFFGYMMKIASFNPIDVASFIETHTKMTSRDPVNVNFEVIGLGSIYLIVNLGTILLVLMAFPVVMAITAGVKLTKWKKTTEVSNKIQKMVFWNSTLRFLKESFVIILICCFINLEAFTIETRMEVVSSCLTVLLLIICFTVPTLLIIGIHRNYRQLKAEGIRAIFGAAYSDQRLHRENNPKIPNQRWGDREQSRKQDFLSFASFFYIRRIVLVLTVVYLRSYVQA